MAQKLTRIALDRTKLLGFRLDPKPAHAPDAHTTSKLGAKFGTKLGGKAGTKTGTKPAAKL